MLCRHPLAMKQGSLKISRRLGFPGYRSLDFFTWSHLVFEGKHSSTSCRWRSKCRYPKLARCYWFVSRHYAVNGSIDTHAFATGGGSEQFSNGTRKSEHQRASIT